MISWFRRNTGEAQAEAEPQVDEDSPEALISALGELVAFINRNSGGLPAETTVLARQVTDVLWTIIQSSEDRALDVHAVITVRAITQDYLPTTLRAYLALDPALTEVAGRTGTTPRDSAADQVAALWESAASVLQATAEQDVSALMVQGKFLETKFARSDLEL